MRSSISMQRISHRIAVLAVASTLALIGLGGVVTSKGVGMSVPDWPTTYGYNMFFFPVSQWTGGIFYEHSHRLAGAVVGLLTSLLAAWLWCFGQSRSLRRWGLLAFVLVCVQGVLGGLRVTWMRDEIGIVHAALAQIFLVLLVALALRTSAWWERVRRVSVSNARPLKTVFAVCTGIIFCQLVVGAAMRHQHAGLAIPDFPAAYGGWWPDTSEEAVAIYNQQRHEATALNPITRGGILLQMAHRLAAVLILGLTTAAAWLARRRLGSSHVLSRLALLWLGCVLAQALLGAATIWTNKSADIATAHVVLGAVCLAVGAALMLIDRRMLAHEPSLSGVPDPAASPGFPTAPSQIPL